MPPEGVEASQARPVSPDRFENYDIRTDTTPSGLEKLSRLREPDRRVAPPRPNAESRFKVEFNDDLGIAEVIESKFADNTSLASAAGRKRSGVLRDFVSNNHEIFGLTSTRQLVATADYTNPDGNLSFVRFEQHLDGVPVFGAEVKAGFSRRGEMFRVVNSLAPALDDKALDRNFGTAESAISNAAAHIDVTVAADDLIRQENGKSAAVIFTGSVFTDPVLAERFYFPVGNGVVRAAWRVLVRTPGPAYYVVVDAADGTLLWRKNLTEHQASPATFNVYGNIFTSLMKTADSPSPFSPGCLVPIACAQPPAIARMNFTLIGNEGVYAFNNLGWIPDTGLPVRTPANPNITDGNNVEAGIDRMAPNGVDDNGWAFGNPTRVFSYAYNPAPGNPAPGEEPVPQGPQPYPPTAFQQGVIAHGFYTANRWHDEMYRFGFTEQAGNFQHFNFGRGGSEGDRLSFEIQDGSGTNGANFATTADGVRPFMQMFIWTGSTPDRDGALDAQVVTHEMTHGLSNRLHGNATGLGSNMARAMGEGWSDFYALALLSEPADHPLGTHAVAGYITHQIFTDFESNYYYGLRRFPVAVWASRGPNGLPHNPLTFRYINSGCGTLIGTTSTNPNSAYPRGPLGSANCDQVHNMGEVWAVALWEVRDQLIQRFAEEGNRRVLQYVTDGMKLSPLQPTIIQARDAILAAAAATDAGDVGPIWRGFAIRGIGSTASIQNIGTGSNNTVVTESFELPAQFRRPTRADFDGDGRTDVSVFRPSDRNWYLNRSTAGFTAVNWGIATDKPLADDFDGDGKGDIAVFRATADGSMPDYYILQSATSTVSFVSWGVPGDIAVTEDFDGDNKADHTIFRPSTGQFWVRRSTDASILISRPMPGGIPLVGDFDGDGKGDFGTFTDGRWMLSRSADNYSSGIIVDWGTAGDRAVPADYDGDGKDDIAVYRPSDGTWYISNSAGGNRFVNFGISTDVPVPADYDGDARTDIAVYRNGVWYINRSSSSVLITSFGLSGDLPLPASFIP
ncbi:MAG: M36 family metallopeptidase [Acidobacteriota bacterium]